MTEHRAGRLLLVGTPLGNRGDLSPRARAAITSADLLLCEDTRSPLRLLGEGAALPPRHSCFVGNEAERVELLLRELAAGHTVAFLSEAGLPVWSDPGRLLVRAAVAAGHAVDAIPGPTAASVALAVSGFAAEGACFLGFLPRRGQARDEALSRVARAFGPVILYEAPGRVSATLRELARRLPDAAEREVLVARELTKVHQELRRGPLTALAAELSGPLRGEVTIVLATGPPAEDPAPAQAARQVLDLVVDGKLTPRERAKRIAELTDLPAREVYRRLGAQKVNMKRA
jgi:16S rRNA (cytidine1402-2'-O)-methyltransferase